MLRMDRLAVYIVIVAMACALAYGFVIHRTVKQHDHELDAVTDELTTMRTEIRALAYRLGGTGHQECAEHDGHNDATVETPSPVAAALEPSTSNSEDVEILESVSQEQSDDTLPVSTPLTESKSKSRTKKSDK